jgi:CDP-diacylglycerol---serine O-phosphatidyltransferase
VSGQGPGEIGRLRDVPMRALIPNAITLMALCSGLSGMRFALAGKWEHAVLLVVFAGVLDGIDGRIARLLKGSSRFGAELDSLSDVIAFGVAPALIIYTWSLQHIPVLDLRHFPDIRGLGWPIALLITVCAALRLARFNANLDSEDQPHKRLGFNTGVPSPAGAGLTLAPVIFCLWLKPDMVPLVAPNLVNPDVHFVQSIFQSPLFVGAWTAGVALLMVSNIPTFSWKSIRINPAWRIPILLGVGLFAGALLTTPFGTLGIVTIVYVALIPLAWRSYRRQLKQGKLVLPDSAPEIVPVSLAHQADHGADSGDTADKK